MAAVPVVDNRQQRGETAAVFHLSAWWAFSLGQSINYHMEEACEKIRAQRMQSSRDCAKISQGCAGCNVFSAPPSSDPSLEITGPAEGIREGTRLPVGVEGMAMVGGVQGAYKVCCAHR